MHLAPTRYGMGVKMREKNGAVKDLRIAYIGGGSRGWAWSFMTDLSLGVKMEGIVRLYDIDRLAA